MKASDFTALARQWVGVPHIHQGSSRMGVDCRGLIVGIAREAGILPKGFKEVKDYSRTQTEKLRDEVEKLCIQIYAPREGCLVLIRWRLEQKKPSHVAYCAGETLIHSYNNVGKVVEHGYRQPWLRMTESFWALPGLTNE